MKKLRIIAACLAVLCLLAPIMQTVSAAELLRSSGEIGSLDFSSFGNTSFLARISPSDLLTMLLEQVYHDDREVSEAEKNYLDRYFDEYLVYDSALPPSLISIESGEHGVTVMAKPYSYQSKNGETLMYLPVRVTMGNITKSLSYSSQKKSYVAELNNSTDLDSLTVYYSGSITLSKESINRLVTMAFDDASQAILGEQTMLEYTAALAEYQNYLRAMDQYRADCLNYEEYLSSLELYRQAMTEYEKNQAEWESYRQKYSVYESYLEELRIYNQTLEVYNREYNAYLTKVSEREAYLKNLDRIHTSLIAIESLFLAPSDQKTGTLYKALQNAELVAMFEKYQGVLTKNFGIKKETITELRADADHLNELLGGYEEARKISEKEAFDFYKQNYEEICRLFNSLYQRMSDIFQPPAGFSASNVYTLMCAKLDTEYDAEEASYKKWRIKNVLAHIYLICLCLDDARTPDATWNFYADDGKPHTYYFSNLLAQNVIISDTNSANPSALSWRNEVPEPTPPTMPTPPIEVVEPLQPQIMSEPTPPEVIEEPIEPEEKEAPTPPLESDHSLVLRAGEICLALQEGALFDRAEQTEDPTITLPELSIEKKIRGVSIYGFNSRLLDANDPNSLPLPSTDSEELPITWDDGYDVYTFSGWSTARDGSSISAVYQRTAKTYTATFKIDGVTVYEIQVPITQTPTFVGSTEKNSSETVNYFFETWNPPLSPMYEDTVYEATYREEPRTYLVTFKIRNKVLTQRYSWQELPIEPTLSEQDLFYLSGTTLFEFVGWDQSISPVTQDTVYTAQYRAVGAPIPPNDPCETNGHTWANATCTVSKTCTVCGTPEGNALGHAEVAHEAKTPTCTEKGWDAYITCSRCDYTTYAEKAALGHTPADAVVENNVDSTCTEAGSYDNVVYCSVCGEEISRTPVAVDALGHDEIAHEAKAPTCTEIGWDAYVTCSRCDYTTYVEKAALGHTSADAVVENNVDPTCTEAGSYDTVVYCSVCNAEISRVTIIVPATGCNHEWIEATCTSPKTCSKCGGMDGVALGHDEISHEAKAPTCTEKGWDAYVTCSRCDYTTYVEKAALNHDEVAHEAKAPTCTEKGWDAYVTCSRCDYTTYAETAALGHTEAIVVGTSATCTATGLTNGKKCSICDAILVAQEVIPALGHNEVAHEAKAPTCTEIGWENYVTCSRCDYTTYVETAALGHTEATVAGTAATCTATGLTDGKKCSVCNEVLVAQEVIPATGHHWADATCELAKTCTVCGTTEGAALGHNWREATLEDPKTCMVCGKTEGDPLSPEEPEESISFEKIPQGYLLSSSQNRIPLFWWYIQHTLNNANTNRLTVRFSRQNITLSLNAVAMQALQNSAVNEIFLDQHETLGTAIRFFKTDGTEILLDEGELRLTIPHSFDADARVFLSAYHPSINRTQKSVPYTRTATTIEATVSAGSYYRPYERFTVTLNVGTHGQAMTNENLYSEGERIHLTVNADAHYRISALFFKNPLTGETIKVDPSMILMPAWDAELCVEFAPIEYTITFIYHGQTKTETYLFGQTLTFPEIPTSFEEDGLFYTFIGWSETSSVVTGDATYTANYHSIPIDEVADDGEGGAWNAVIWNILVPIAIVALVILGILIAVPIIIVKRVKKKKKQMKNE